MAKQQPFLHCQSLSSAALQMRKQHQPRAHSLQVAQPKIATGQQIRKQPVAPPVYRPQSIPKVLQRKAAVIQSPVEQAKHGSAAPTPYCPQPTPKVLQTKTVGSPQAQIAQPGRKPVAPPVYRPQPVPKVLQRKTAASRQPQGAQSSHKLVAPPAYRPQVVPKVLQLKMPNARQLPSVHKMTGTIQPVFKVDKSIANDPKAAEAYRLMRRGLPNDESSMWLEQEQKVTVNFLAKKLKATTNGDTEKLVVFPTYGTCFHQLEDRDPEVNNKAIEVNIQVNSNMLEDDKTTSSDIAMTIMHELGAHVAPYVDVMKKITGSGGLDETDFKKLKRDFMQKASADHEDIRNRSTNNFENLVEGLAKSLAEAGDMEKAKKIVYSYLVNISRYDKKGVPEEDDQEVVKQVFKTYLDIPWASAYLKLDEPMKVRLERILGKQWPSYVGGGAVVALILSYVAYYLFNLQPTTDS